MSMTIAQASAAVRRRPTQRDPSLAQRRDRRATTVAERLRRRVPGRDRSAGGAEPQPPTAKAKLTILYATESGNAEALAGAARKSAARLGFAARVLDMMDATPAQLAGAENLLVIASTWGEGDPPQRAEGFMAALMAEEAPRLDGLRFAVLALGDRAYANFCETGKQIDARLEALGGTRIAPRIDCDLDFQKPAAGWIDTTLREIAPAPEPGAAVIHVDFARPGAAEDRARTFDAEITAQINLNSSRSDIETHHVELSLAGSGIAYEPGDSLGFCPAQRSAPGRGRVAPGRTGWRRGVAHGADRTLRHHHADADADRRLRGADRRCDVARAGGRPGAHGGVLARAAVRRSVAGGAAQADGASN